MNKTSYNYLSKTSSFMKFAASKPLDTEKPVTPAIKIVAPLPPLPLTSLPLGLESCEKLCKYDLYDLSI